MRHASPFPRPSRSSALLCRRPRRRRAHPERQPAAQVQRPDRARRSCRAPTTAPVTIRVSGAIGTADGERPPELNRISIAFNRYGHGHDPRPAGLRTGRARADDLGGRPRNMRRGAGRPRQIQSQRRAARPRHLPGRAATSSPSTRARTASRRCCSTYTGPTRCSWSFVLTFRIVRRREGRIRHDLRRPDPEDRRQARLRHQPQPDLRPPLHRTRARSAASSAPAAPPRPAFPGGVFTLARGTFNFDNGQRISTSLARNCWVR